MPIGAFESEILRVIARNRNPESFLGGATVLHQAPDSPRSSRDVDIFHDTTESLAQSAEKDVEALRAAGFEVTLGKLMGTFLRADVRAGPRQTKVEWVFDSAFRFFPIEPDPELGWRLNFWDAATNKILALFGRHEFRDYLDAHFLHQRHLHLGALIWAAAAKDPGLTPELILDWIRRSTRYAADQIQKVNLASPPDLVTMKKSWLLFTEEAAQLISKLPPADMGCFYLDSAGKPICPDPASPDFAKWTRHFGSVKGAWPRIVEGD